MTTTNQVYDELAELQAQGVDLPYSAEEIVQFESLGFTADLTTGELFRPEDYTFELTVLGEATAVVLESEVSG